VTLIRTPRPARDYEDDGAAFGVISTAV
jgi:hypothetical protein